MVDVKVLIKGYYRPKPVRVCSTITLIKDNNTNIIIDPGTVENTDIIYNALKQENLSTNDIDYVGITHSHVDHYKNISFFHNARIIDYWGEWKNDYFFEKKPEGNITDNISILKTPGHSSDSISFIVTTKKEVIAVCGDVFWFKNGPKFDSLAENHTELNRSRQLILDKADLIIPGHGAPFTTQSYEKLKDK